MSVLMMSSWSSRPLNSSAFCPLIFDSWSCFNLTEAGTTQHEACPRLPDLGFDPARTAEKYCDETGEWWVHPETNK